MKFKSLFTSILIVLSFFHSTFLNATEQSDGYIKGKVAFIYPKAVDGKQRIYFRIKGDSCKVGEGDIFWYFDVEDTVTEAWFSMLLGAAVSDMEISIYSTPKCNPNEAEKINFMYQNF